MPVIRVEELCFLFCTLCTFCNLMGEILINPFSTLNKPLRNPMETLNES
ncbi:hypothetical protein DesLBE_5287 [Desulfitobacterium sp. LBE]|uniref:Uncharacterized protein n=1 Tax=Desulfitobacterium hafniense TaxID=49338 RepID=A0A098B0C0_DESHA|nr:hypothetical protein DesLBE_5287 [Desulfitobacterium sp. LBE]CDX02298.1 Hypothetical protein DPCES_2411 [Desulfitobacterium hafniense]